ncbi:MAG: flagellar export protein FliJ [Candidatus Tectimicrobiota bacterium]
MYQFRLQRVLEYRRRCEEDRQQALRQAQLLHNNELARLEELRLAAQAQAEALHDTPGTGFSSDEWRAWQRHYARLAQEVEGQQEVVTRTTERVVAQRQQLLVARQETKVIEKLDEQARQRYRAELAQRDNQLLDELALTRSRHVR